MNESDEGEDMSDGRVDSSTMCKAEWHGTNSEWEDMRDECEDESEDMLNRVP